MNLSLEIVSQNGQSLGAARRKVFGPEGGRIGRAAECEWVLANPYVSRHHATIGWISGTYYIESAGESGVAIGTPQAVISKLERRPLKPGDRIYIDEYEVLVGLDGLGDPAAPASASSSAAAVDAFSPTEDPFGLGATRGLVDPLEAAPEELDPLRRIGATGGSPVVTAPRQESHWNHTAAVSDQFAPPPATRSAPSAALIPDDWDKTSFGRAKPNQVVPPGPAASMTPSGSARPLPGASVPAPPAGLRPGRGAGSGGTAAGAGAASAGFDFAALLQAAGVDPATLSPDTAGSFGLILRSVVQGVIDVLRARAQIKEQFRLSHTIVKTAENNPLKFAVNAEDALTSLLGKRNPAYLPAVEAFEDAFNDIRFHQLAMLAGMRAGFDHVMSRFDPQQLQEAFDKRARRGGLLSMSAKSRYWEQFVEEFQQLAGDREQAFRRLFAEEFAAAYEKQLELLKRSHGKVQH